MLELRHYQHYIYNITTEYHTVSPIKHIIVVLNETIPALSFVKVTHSCKYVSVRVKKYSPLYRLLLKQHIIYQQMELLIMQRSGKDLGGTLTKVCSEVKLQNMEGILTSISHIDLSRFCPPFTLRAKTRFDGHRANLYFVCQSEFKYDFDRDMEHNSFHLNQQKAQMNHLQ